MMAGRLWPGLAGGVAGAALLTGLIAFAHTGAGRPLLRTLGLSLGGAGRLGCPLGYDRPMAPEARERARARFRSSHEGTERAADRPALGFSLGHTTRDEIAALMKNAGVRCNAATGLADLDCHDVPRPLDGSGGDPPPSRNLWFSFGARGQLLAVVATTRDPRAEVISAAFAEAEESIRVRTRGGGVANGSPLSGGSEVTSGDSSPLALAAGLLRQASAEFRFANYYAVARATNMGDGFLLTEEYRSLVD